MVRSVTLKGDLGRYATANARVRTLLGQLLGRDGLQALYSYPSRAAMVEMLARTPYGPALLAYPRMEYGLAGRLIDVGTSILGFLSGPEAAFVHAFLLRYELENIKVVIRAVHRQRSWTDIAAHVQPLGRLATVDPHKLAAAVDLHELTTHLAGTAYGNAAAAALHRVETAGLFALESALEIDYYERLWATAARLRTADVERARALLGLLYDVLNLSWIGRYRDALALSREEIINYTLRQGRWVTGEVRAALADSAPGVWAALRDTPYAALFGDADETAADRAIVQMWRAIGLEVERGFRLYPFHIGVPLGVLLAQEIELRDLRVLLAAKAQGLAPDTAFEHVASVRH